jgi:rod shape-determining protein MreC
MLRFIEEKYKEIFVSLILILLLVTVTSSHRLEMKMRWYDKAVMIVTAPVQYVLSVSVKGSINLFSDYLFLIDVNKENKFLLTENMKLRHEIDTLREVSIENLRLRKLLLFKEKISPFMIPAEIISKDASTEFKTMRINKGEEDGIKIMMPVVNYEGVVGRVISTTGRYSDVLIITDPNFAVDALVQRSRTRGIVEGKSQDTCMMKYLNRLDDIQVGDKIITSGLGGYFPKGQLVGEVKSVKRKRYGITQDVEVKPSVNFDKLEEVFVVVFPDAKLAEPEQSVQTPEQDAVPPLKEAKKRSKA